MGPGPQRVDRGPSGLLERQHDLARIEEALGLARGGAGRLVVVEGPAGIGKTALLAAAAASARAGGCLVLSARGAQLEAEFPFGVVRQLLEPALSGRTLSGPDPLLRGSVRQALVALELLPGDGAPAAGEDAELTIDATPREGTAAIVHGLFWAIAALAEPRPLLVCVDDAHWSDLPSWRLIEYLARRLEDLPVTVLLALRLGDSTSGASRVGGLTAAVDSEILTLRPLSEEACVELVQRELAQEALPAFCEACHIATGGNPFLLTELIAELRRGGTAPTAKGARQIGTLRPARVDRFVLAAIRRQGSDAIALAHAVAVLGDGVRPRLGRLLAGLDPAAAAKATDALVAANVLVYRKLLFFVHPLVRTVVYESIPAAQRSLAHAEAARLLRMERADPDRVAAQLLLAEPTGDEEVVTALRDAATRAERRAAPEVAVTCLRRALEEPPPASERLAILLGLGRTRMRAGDPHGLHDLFEAHAAAAAETPTARAAIALEVGRGLMLVDRYTEALELFTTTRVELGDADRPLASLLKAEAAGAALLDVSTAKHAAIALEDSAPERAGESLGERLLLAYGAFLAAARGEPAESVAATALTVLSFDDLASEQTIAAFCFAAFVLCIADRYDDALRALGRAIARAGETGSTLVFVISLWLRSHAHFRRGDLAAAESDAQNALEAGLSEWFTVPIAFLCDAFIERGELDAGDALFETYGVDKSVFPNLLVGNVMLDTRGRLRCAQGRLREGLDDLLAVGERLAAWETTNPAVIAWRSSAALAYAALGERDAARRLADEEVTFARRFGAPRALGIALRAAGRVREPPASIELLREATAVLEGSSARLELARTLTDLGAALRRAGYRADARAPLRHGLDLASRCGATALSTRAREELVTAGARPRRERLSGTDALTASERRIASLAADGMSNREIAQTLFITIKTVKAHLGHVFQKLEITSRADLPAALGGRAGLHPDSPGQRRAA